MKTQTKKQAFCSGKQSSESFSLIYQTFLVEQVASTIATLQAIFAKIDSKKLTLPLTSILLMVFGLGYFFNPIVESIIQPNNFVNEDLNVELGLDILKYETETLSSIDTITEFNTGSFSNDQFLTGSQDLDVYNDAVSSNDILSLNHYGDNRPDLVNNGDWWDVDSDSATKYNWRYRQCFDVDYTAGATNLSEYQIYLDFDTVTEISAGKMQSAGEDIRIVDTSGNLVDHYIADDINTASTRIWIQPDLISAGTTTQYCMYYGNPSATSTSDKDSVFTYTSQEDIYYVLPENADNTIIDFGSYTDTNSIQVDSYNQNFDKYEINSTTGGGSLSPASDMRALGPIQATTAGSNVDSVVPAANAGLEFNYRMDRNTHMLQFVSPYCDANVEIFNTTDLVTPVAGGSFTIPMGTAYNWNESVEGAAEFANDDAAYIRTTNNCPIIGFHSATNNGDTFPMFPSSTEDWYGVGSGTLEISAASTTTVEVYDSGAGASTNYTLNAGNDYHVTDAGAGNQGAAPSQRVVVTSGNGIGAKSLADSDGGESTTFYPRSQMDTKYITPEAAQYVAIATIAGANTTVEVYNNAADCTFGNTSPSPNQTQTANSNNSFPGHILFGAITQGACLISNHPIAPYFEKNSNDESNLWSWKQGRPSVSVAPTIAIGSVEAGSWNLGTGSTWNTRLPVTVTNNIAGSLDEFPIRIPLVGQTDILTNAQVDGGDVRVGGSLGDGSGIQDYYLEEFGNTFAGDGDLWTQVNVAGSSSSTIYLYYNATTVQASAANQEAVFTYTSGKSLYFVVDDVPPAAAINIYSLINDNELFFQGASYSDLDLGENYTDPGVTNNAVGVVVQGEVASVTGPINATFRTDGTDSISPISWSGTKFLTVDTRDEDEYSLLAPFANSTVTFERHDGTGWVAFGADVNLTQGVVQNIIRDVNNGTGTTPANGVRITSTTPILIHKHANRTTPFSDSLLLYPVEEAFEESTNEYILYGVNSNGLMLAAENEPTTATIYYDNGTDSGPISINTAGSMFYNEGGGVTQGQGRGMKIVADGPIAAFSQADSDGNEAASFLPKKEFGNEFLFTTGIQYVSIVSNDPGTVCEIFDDLGASAASVTLGANSSTYVNQAELGTFASGDPLQYTAGYYMTCDDPVFAYFEKNVDDSDSAVTDESTFIHHIQARKRVQIEPIITDIDDVSVLEEGLYFESGWDMDTTATDPEAYVEYVFDSGDSDVFWNQFRILEDSFDNVQVTQNNVEKYKLETAAVNDGTCTTATYPAFEEVTINYPDLNIEIPEKFSDKNCIIFRLTLRTGDQAHTPKIDELLISYYNPVPLNGVLNNPTVTIPGSDSDKQFRALKFRTTNTGLTSSQAYLTYLNNTNGGVFTNLDLDLYSITPETSTNMFDWPPIPGAEEDSANSTLFQSGTDLALYVTNDRTLTTGNSNFDLSFRVDLNSFNGPILDREFELIILD